MTAYSTANSKPAMTRKAAAPVVIVPTAITKAAPAEVTGAALTIKDGDLVVATKTGFPELDGKAWIAANVAAGISFELLGSDTTNSAGALAAAPELAGYDTAADLVSLGCLGDLAMAREAPTAVDAGTYADPAQTITSQVVKAGTLTFKGPLNAQDEGYDELYMAWQDANARQLVIKLHDGNGYVVAPITVGMVQWDIPLNGAEGFSGTMVMGNEPRHLY